jgi:hypothetical protein
MARERQQAVKVGDSTVLAEQKLCHLQATNGTSRKHPPRTAAASGSTRAAPKFSNHGALGRLHQPLPTFTRCAKTSETHAATSDGSDGPAGLTFVGPITHQALGGKQVADLMRLCPLGSARFGQLFQDTQVSLHSCVGA